MTELDKMLNQAGKAWLEEQMEQKAKWALAYDEGSFRYGIMTTNSSESFNRVFTGVRSFRSATNILSRGGILRRGI
jgi:hypothetical protein